MKNKNFFIYSFAIILSGLLILVSGCEDELLPPLDDQEIIVEQHSVTTEDGVDIALFHYYPSDKPVGPKPILLCPGIFQNHYAFDLQPDSSMARYLAGQGIDTWAIDYRGRGASGAPEGTSSSYAPWSTDDFGYLDIASAAEYISDQAGGELFILGFCEGAAAVSAYLLEKNPGYVCGQIGVGPRIVVGATVEDPYADWTTDQIADNFFFFIEPTIAPNLYLDIPLIYQSIYHVFNELDMESQFFALELWQLLWNRENMTDSLAKDVIFKVFSPISGNEIKQLLRGANYCNRLGICTFDDSALEQAAGPFCYLDRLPEITVPTLILAGNHDDFTPPVNASLIYDLIGAEEKSYRLFGLSEGDSSDYGHYDLTLGSHASEDVYPVIADWILDRM